MARATEVLVVGAGPIGLFSAYCLRKAGVDVTIVDQNDSASGHSFAVVLHPRTVTLLTSVGVTEPLLWQGRSFERLRVFSEGGPRAVLGIPAPNALSHGALTLPQDVLRRALEASLREAGVRVQYRCRFDELSRRAENVRVHLTASPEMGSASKPQHLEVEARFLIGADGCDSSVRRALRISTLELAPPELYGIFNVRGNRAAQKDAAVVIDDLSSAVYPLREGASRYAFQLPLMWQQPLESATFSELKRARMPWEPTGGDHVQWSGKHRIARALVESFGYGRTWLVGDAAHTTSPLGAQSLNVGLREARDLTDAIVGCLKGASLDRLAEGYGEQRRIEWRRLMGLDSPGLRSDAPAWARKNLARLVASLPVSGDDLDDVLAQLGVTLP